MLSGLLYCSPVFFFSLVIWLLDGAGPSVATVSVAVSGGGLHVSAPTMMIKETSLRRDPDLRGELAFLARGCDFVLPSRFKKRLKSFQQQQVSQCNEQDGLGSSLNVNTKCKLMRNMTKLTQMQNTVNICNCLLMIISFLVSLCYTHEQACMHHI